MSSPDNRYIPVSQPGVQKVWEDKDVRYVVVYKSRKATKRMTIRIDRNSGVVKVVVPFRIKFEDGYKFFTANRAQVVKLYYKEMNKMILPVDETKRAEMIALMTDSAKRTLPPRVKELAAMFGLTGINRVTVKHNKTNWGSCSALGNINLNINLVRLPVALRDHIIQHEMAHMIHLNHSYMFHKQHEKFDKVMWDNIMSQIETFPPKEASEYMEWNKKIKLLAANGHTYPVSAFLDTQLKSWAIL